VDNQSSDNISQSSDTMVSNESISKNDVKKPLVDLKNAIEILRMFPKAESRAFQAAFKKFPSELYALEEKGLTPQWIYLKYQIHLNNVTVPLDGELQYDDIRINTDEFCRTLWCGIYEHIWHLHNGNMFQINTIKRWLNDKTQKYTMTVYLQIELNDNEKQQIENKLNILRTQS
jgi:hypothetical protein